jgi:1-aminocyclopropane-1-carboxylate deaminase/D-cysteine desulfhydrase-like pyridoxal-dependent ACC family enzyme
MDLTKVQKIDEYYFKRDDDYRIGDAIGGKARVARCLVEKAIAEGFNKVVTTGSRDSRQCDIVSSVCDYYNVECFLFMPSGKDTDVIRSIQNRETSVIHRTKVGYNSVLIAHSKKWAIENNAYYIPFGMELQECININMHQVQNVPKDVKRIVIPCGGGMQMISVIHGLKHYGMSHIKVVGVQVGADPKRVINAFLPDLGFFGNDYNYEIIKSDIPYDKHTNVTICGIELDPIYEAKCVPFLEKGDLLWIVGKRL